MQKTHGCLACINYDSSCQHFGYVIKASYKVRLPKNEESIFLTGYKMIDEKAEPSVWRTAALAIAVFIGVMFVAGMFGSIDTIAIASQ